MCALVGVKSGFVPTGKGLAVPAKWADIDALSPPSGETQTTPFILHGFK